MLFLLVLFFLTCLLLEPDFGGFAGGKTLHKLPASFIGLVCVPLLVRITANSRSRTKNHNMRSPVIGWELNDVLPDVEP